MYLSRLSSQMKFLFLELELHLSKCDGSLGLDEKAMIDMHCDEMRIDNNYYQNEMTLEEVFEQLKTAGQEEQNIIYLEIVQLVMADNLYHENERSFMSRLEGVLGFDSKKVQEVFDAVSSYRHIVSKLDHLVFDSDE